jgi:hypothetical protein
MWSATHLLKYFWTASAFPFALPAAGLPGTSGGKALVVSALHSLATFNGMANALVIGSTVMQTDARITLQNFILANMIWLRARMLPDLR